MNNDLPSVRAEIKAWERKFRADEGRDPTVEDIRKLPHIAAKYKTYKKLSKAAASQQPSALPTSSQSPSTPTRPSRARTQNHSTLALNSRLVTAAPPVTSFNPFSPQKAKGKERERPTPRVPQPIFNPFASPSKPKPSAQPSKATLSQGPSTESPPQPPPPQAPSTAVSRARKRLRGEPVSPSPSKDKRRRTGSQTVLAFPKLAALGSKPFPGSKDMEQDDSDGEHDETFIDDSPVKSSNTRAFSLLFEDAQPNLNADLFGTKSEGGKKLGQKLFGSTGDVLAIARDVKPLPSLHTQSKHFGAQSTASTSLPSTASQTRLATPTEETVQSANETKASTPDESIDEPPKSPLLPPSPPPPSSATSRGPGQAKRKANSKVFANRKKAKLSSLGESDGESGSERSDVKPKVKIVDRPQVKPSTAEDDLDFDFDPLLDLPRSTAPAPLLQEDDGQVLDVDLPDKFRDVLDLETIPWREHGVGENKVVDRLIYGRRTTSYDSKKGEIWDVGEDEGDDGDAERALVDNEWEDEPVPWEVAEL